MIDGGSEELEQEFMSYLISRRYTMAAEFAEHFCLSSRSAAYWLGCLVKSGKLGIARIESQTIQTPADGPMVVVLTSAAWSKEFS